MTPPPPSVPGPSGQSTADRVRFLAVGILMIFTPQRAINLATRPLEPYNHVGWGWRLLVSLPVSAGLLGIAFLVARLIFAGSSAPAAAKYAMIWGMPVIGFQLVGAVNVLADREPGLPVVTDCLSITPQRRNTVASVEVASWTEPGRAVTLPAGLFSPSACEAQQPVRFVFHPGRLGAEWISLH